MEGEQLESRLPGNGKERKERKDLQEYLQKLTIVSEDIYV